MDIGGESIVYETIQMAAVVVGLVGCMMVIALLVKLIIGGKR